MTRAEAYWVLEEIRKESFSADYVEALGIAQETIEFVDLMPSDMVAVVRCKDCKHKRHLQGATDEANVCGLGWGLRGIVAEEDFCSYGERKEADGNA